ncbi:MAG: DUF4012 domain-containing protein [Patescibacteria group bacterium]
MKQLWVLLGLGILVLGFLAGGCGYVGLQTGKDILNNTLKIKNWELKITRWCFSGLPLVDKLDKILDNKTYIVLLQNNTELRPSGGFMGSYAVLRAKGQGLSDVRIEDIYQPDGQLVGYVEPPAPIKKAFPFGSWKLRDANWDVDFQVAGEQIAWFLEQGGEKVDGVVAVNLSLVDKMLEIFGGVKTVTYDERVTAQNLANLAQTYAEVNKEKRDFLGAVGAALFERIKQSKPIEQIKLFKLIYDQLQQKQILVWMKDREIQQEILEKGWGGDLGNYGGDHLYIVEANLGANKANCCVSRNVTQSVDGNNEKVSIRWENSSQFTDPKPPVFWGGNYIAYIRVVIPAEAVISGAEKYDIEERGRFKIVGFWITVPAGETAVTELSYSLPVSGQILVKRQPGIDSFPYKLVVEGKVVVSKQIDRDEEIKVK